MTDAKRFPKAKTSASKLWELKKTSSNVQSADADIKNARTAQDPMSVRIVVVAEEPRPEAY
jgi:hypothetical protein